MALTLPSIQDCCTPTCSCANFNGTSPIFLINNVDPTPGVSPGVAAALWWNTALGRLWLWDGTQWQALIQ